MYDYIIVGGGPGGLICALILADYGYRVEIIEREKNLGGCHRVNRLGGYKFLFSEHGPRIYSSNYLSTMNILDQIGYDTKKLFAPYSLSISNLNEDILQVLSLREILAFAIEFIIFLFYPGRSRRKTMQEFMDRWNFSPESQDIIERICRLTDGAGPNRYTLFEFLELVNQYVFYQVQQPRIPNDLGMICALENAIKKTGRVKITTEAEVTGFSNIIGKPQNGTLDKIQSIDVLRNGVIMPLIAKNFIFTTPLTNFVNILENEKNQKIKNSFGDFNELKKFAKQSEYITYVPIVFNWRNKLEIPQKWGYPKHDWEVAIVILSDYMVEVSPGYQTVFSTCICNTNSKSKVTGKTANQSNKEEVIREVLRQVKEIYPGLPDPDLSIMSPEMAYNTALGRWENKNKAFVLTTSGYFPKQMSEIFSNLYLTGPFNGYSPNSFTTMESAITNALHLLHQLVPESKQKYPIKRPLTVRKVLGGIGLGLSLLYLYRKRT